MNHCLRTQIKKVTAVFKLERVISYNYDKKEFSTSKKTFTFKMIEDKIFIKAFLDF